MGDRGRARAFDDDRTTESARGRDCRNASAGVGAVEVETVGECVGATRIADAETGAVAVAEAVGAADVLAVALDAADGATFITVMPPVVRIARRAGSEDAECRSRTLRAAAAVPTARTPTTDMAVAMCRRRFAPRMAHTVRPGRLGPPPATAKNR